MQACSVKILAKRTCVGPKKVFFLAATYAGQDRSAALGHWPLTCDLLFFIPHHQRGIPHQESSFLMLVKAIFLVDSGCSFSQSTTEGYLLSLGSLLGIGSNCLDVSGPKRWC
jgi:hypothetical protein